MIYLASPYSHKLKTVRHKRFIDICNVAGKLINRGHYIFCPISMNHPWKEHCDEELGYTWEFWEPYDKAMIELCHELWVCTMDGWKESVGIAAEIEYAKKLNMRIGYVDPETLEITTEEPK